MVGEHLDTLSKLVSRSLGTTDLLSLDETDELFSAYEALFTSCTTGSVECYRQQFSRSSRGELFAQLAALGSAELNHTVVLFDKTSRYTGAPRLRMAEVFASAAAILEYDGDDLKVFAPEPRCGVLLDYHEHEQQLELWVWGKDWLDIVRAMT